MITPMMDAAIPTPTPKETDAKILECSSKSNYRILNLDYLD